MEKQQKSHFEFNKGLNHLHKEWDIDVGQNPLWKRIWNLMPGVGATSSSHFSFHEKKFFTGLQFIWMHSCMALCTHAWISDFCCSLTLPDVFEHSINYGSITLCSLFWSLLKWLPFSSSFWQVIGFLSNSCPPGNTTTLYDIRRSQVIQWCVLCIVFD